MITQTEIREHFIAYNKKYSKNGKCYLELIDRCENLSISSHSIARSLLDNISDKGNLYKFEFNLHSPTLEEALKIKKVGIKQASTFKGFCAQHDNDLFSKIDQANFEIGNETLALLLLGSNLNQPIDGRVQIMIPMA